MKTRLAILIPLLLILSALVSSTLLCLDDMRLSAGEVERTGASDLNIVMTQLQNILDTQLASGSSEEARLSLSVTSLHPSIRTLLLADERDVVLLASRYSWVGERAGRVTGYDANAARRVKASRASFTTRASEHGLLRGYYPVTLGLDAGGLARDRIGSLYVEYDLAPGLANARSDAIARATWFSALMLAFALVMAALLHWLVTRRVSKIGAASRRFAAGDHAARVNLRGRDELAELGGAFDQMAAKIASEQRALRDSERKLSLHLRQTILGVIEWDVDFRAREWNPAAEMIFGYSREEALGRHANDLILLAESAKEVAEVWRQNLEQTGGGYNVNENRTKDGTTIVCEWFNTPLLGDAGEVTGVMSLARDVTESRRGERALRRLNRELRAIRDCGEVLERAEDEQALLEDICRIVCDVAGYRMAWVGYAQDDEARTVRPVACAGAEDGYLERLEISWADAGSGLGPTGVAIRSGESACIQDYLTHPAVALWRDGASRRGYRSSIALPLKDEDARVFGALNIYSQEPNAFTPSESRLLEELAADLAFGIVVLRNRLERKRAEQALVESHSLLNAVVEGTADIVFVKDLQGRYLMINSAGARVMGRSVAEVIGRDDVELFGPETGRPIMESDRQLMASGDPHVVEEVVAVAGIARTYLATEGAYRDADARVIGLIGISRDVTEQKRLEEQFRQAQRMEAVGRLAGGVAHDFNNLLTVINGYSDLVLGQIGVDSPHRETLAEIRKAGQRAATLTRQLLAFSRKQLLQPRVVSLNGQLAELLKLLRRLIGEDVELSLVAAAAPDLANVDPGQFEQVMINLAVNARDAMPRGGRLIIETHSVELDAAYAGRHPEVRPGHYLMVTVSDTGHGMDARTRVRIFEPFFTTKEPGRGTGLGLAMVYGFVKQSGGHIEVYSEVGHGTTFKVYLPLSAETAPAAGTAGEVEEIPMGTETVLLVEDEDAVRTLSRVVLQSRGYTVLEARDGDEALRLAAEHHEPIDALVTDLVMPRMSGRQLADEMARSRPGLRVLFMSGYTEEAVLARGGLEAGVAFLQKPFRPGDLARKLRAVLDSQAAGGDATAQPAAVASAHASESA